MKVFHKTRVLMVLLVLPMALELLAVETRHIEKTFPMSGQVSIRTISGDLELKPSTDGQIHVSISHSYSEESYSVTSELRGDELMLTERFLRGSFSGHSSWIVNLPDSLEVTVVSASGGCRVSDLKVGLHIRNASGNIELNRIAGRIEVRTASGDLEGTGINGDISFNGASGDIKLTGVEGHVRIRGASSDFWGSALKGRVEISLASGDLAIRDSTLSLLAKTSSGDMSVRDVVLDGASELVCASGSVLMRLSAAISSDLLLKSASGRVTLQMNGHQSDVELTCTVGRNRGSVMTPFAFDSERLIEKNGQQYSEKRTRLGKALHRVTLVSSSGDLVVEK